MANETPLGKYKALMRSTDAEIAKKAGLQRVHVTKLRLGRINPSLAVAVKLSEATGLPASDFLKGAA